MSSCHDCDDCFVCVLSVLVASLYQSCSRVFEEIGQCLELWSDALGSHFAAPMKDGFCDDTVIECISMQNAAMKS